MTFQLRSTLRSLVRDWRFTTATIATLTLAIAANTVIFGAAHSVLWRDLPIANADRVYVLWNSYPGGLSRASVAAPEFFDYRNELKTFDALAAVRDRPVNLTGEGEPLRLNGLAVSPELGRVLGVTPAAGRDFVVEDGSPGRRTVLLSHHIWRQSFGGDPSIVGGSIRLDGDAYTVVGILPAGLVFPDADTFSMPRQSDLWIAESWEGLRADSRGNQILRVVGLASTGATRQGIQEDLERVGDRFRRAFPNRYSTQIGWRPAAYSYKDELVGDSRPQLAMLLGSAALVLVVACANVVSLSLGRSAARTREIGIKSALGASPARLARECLLEAAVLGGVAGVLSTVLARWALPVLAAAAPETLPHLSESRLNPAAVAFGFGLSTAVVSVIGLMAALTVTARGPSESLREYTPSGGHAGWRKLRSALVVGELALAFLVVTLAGLLTRTVLNLNRTDLGFVPDGVVSTHISLPEARYAQPEHRAAFFTSALAGLRAQAGIAAAALADPLLLGGERWSGTLEVEGREVRPGEPMPHAEFYRVSDGYFQALRIPLRAGRGFTPEDRADAQLVVVIDSRFAALYWPDEDPIGKRVKIRGPNGPWATVVGVAAPVRRDGPREAGEPQVYIPYSQSRAAMMNVVVRVHGQRTRAADALRSVFRNLDAQLPVSQIEDMRELADRTAAADRFNLILVISFAACTLVLAAVGLYGVISHVVVQSAREIGIRIALGSTPRSIGRRILVRGGLWACCGAGLGIIAAFAIGRAIAALLFQVSPLDASIYAAAAAITVTVALGSAYFPARRVATMDPVRAIRGETT